MLFPTPRASDAGAGPVGNERTRSTGGSHARLADIVGRLFPTPSASDGLGGDAWANLDHNHQVKITQAVRPLTEGYGEYAPYVERWEQRTRPAPPATVPNRNGNAHLSLLFDEWVMGLAAGWVTGLGLARKHALRIIGNGVVPQQAEVAVGDLLDVLEPL